MFKTKKMVAFGFSLILIFVTAITTMAAKNLVPVGHTIGIKINTQGVVITEITEIDVGGNVYKPCAELHKGDIIIRANDKEISSLDDFKNVINEANGKITLLVIRGDKEKSITVEPIYEGNDIRLGLSVKDTVVGIGTMTFYDPENKTYGALGHSINNYDTGKIIPLRVGEIVYSTVGGVIKGTAGKPGELSGNLRQDEVIGTIEKNTSEGIFGKLTDTDIADKDKLVEIGKAQSGKAHILTNVDGDTVEEYEIEIIKVYSMFKDDNRDFMIKVTDEKLIQQTGGIVQGMSGSPILQNGKLVGAVTHVLINDPTRGYGIFIEDMLKSA